MGRDTDRLTIISMNASGRKGRQYQEYRRSVLKDVIGDAKPDMLFLPGDNLDMNSSFVESYRKANVLHQDDTVLLYDSKRIQVDNKLPSLNLTGIDTKKLMYSVVGIKAPYPTQHVVKQFHCISWHWELTQTTSNELCNFAWRYMLIAQYLALTTELEVLIGGDFNLPICQIEELISKHNKLVEKSIDDVKPHFRDLGFLDDMTEYVHRPQRRIRQLRLHKCKSVEGTKQDTEYFISSKEMQLRNTETMESSKSRSSSAQFAVARPRPVVETYCPAPTKTEMCIPARPPRHSGG